MSQVATGILPIYLIYKDQPTQELPRQNKEDKVEERSYMKIRTDLWVAKDDLPTESLILLEAFTSSS